MEIKRTTRVCHADHDTNHDSMLYPGGGYRWCPGGGSLGGEHDEGHVDWWLEILGKIMMVWFVIQLGVGSYTGTSDVALHIFENIYDIRFPDDVFHYVS